MDLRLAERVKQASDINLQIPGFKGELHNFQRVGIAWLYFIQRGILADQCGLGKTWQALGLLQLLKSRGELVRGLILVPAASLLQWRSEALKLTNLDVGVIRGSKSERVGLHMRPWEVVITNYEILHRDLDWFMESQPNVVFMDEASVFKNAETATASNVQLVTKRAQRVYPMTATPIQNNLMDIHSIFSAMHIGLFGSAVAFQNRYCVVERVKVPRRGRLIVVPRIMGYKRMDEFKERVQPFFLRRRYSDVGLQLPSLVVETHWLGLTELQQRGYQELVTRARQRYSEKAIREFRVNIHQIQEVLDDVFTLTGIRRHMSSSKLDWIMARLTGDMSEDKVVIFSRYKRTLEDLKLRLEAANIPYIEITGDISDKHVRFASQEAFNNDPAIKVCLGTSALEMSLNLQAARFVLFVDLLWNPSRVEQLVGRIRRIGSEHGTCCAIILLTDTPFERRIVSILERKQGLADHVFNEESDIFNSISPEDLFALVAEDNNASK